MAEVDSAEFGMGCRIPLHIRWKQPIWRELILFVVNGLPPPLAPGWLRRFAQFGAGTGVPSPVSREQRCLISRPRGTVQRLSDLPLIGVVGESLAAIQAGHVDRTLGDASLPNLRHRASQPPVRAAKNQIEQRIQHGWSVALFGGPDIFFIGRWRVDFRVRRDRA